MRFGPNNLLELVGDSLAGAVAHSYGHSRVGFGAVPARTRLIGQCRSPQGGGTGPGRVRTGRACCAVEVVRPSRRPEEDATGPPGEART